jgi:hypothetical protein
MRTRNWNGTLEVEEAGDATLDRSEADRHQVRRSRSARPSKRRSSRVAGSHPEVGIAGRRNRRWSW